MPLFKTTIVIWSKYDGTKTELDSLAREATSGDAYCSRFQSVLVQNPPVDPDWDDTEFFNEQ
jgi:hypothetical protein